MQKFKKKYLFDVYIFLKKFWIFKKIFYKIFKTSFDLIGKVTRFFKNLN